ncbi:hypothetical protein LEP1GSC116_0149, partial [Leptospira interrogans serovar Icterohaemorrhagiae str. Verdun HP]
ATSFIVNDPFNVRFTACSRNSGEYFLLPFILTFYLYSWKKRCLLLCY